MEKVKLTCVLILGLAVLAFVFLLVVSTYKILVYKILDHVTVQYRVEKFIDKIGYLEKLDSSLSLLFHGDEKNKKDSGDIMKVNVLKLVGS